MQAARPCRPKPIGPHRRIPHSTAPTAISIAPPRQKPERAQRSQEGGAAVVIPSGAETRPTRPLSGLRCFPVARRQSQFTIIRDRRLTGSAPCQVGRLLSEADQPMPIAYCAAISRGGDGDGDGDGGDGTSGDDDDDGTTIGDGDDGGGAD